MSRELYLRQKSASSAAALIEAPTAADAHARFGANAMSGPNHESLSFSINI